MDLIFLYAFVYMDLILRFVNLVAGIYLEEIDTMIKHLHGNDEWRYLSLF